MNQEIPLPFKKYTKKRSWIWDWFEQDTHNKFRAVCVYCHQEIFRLDGDRGSPKKLITHLNSKHSINKGNFMSVKSLQIRQEKLKYYQQTIGPLVTNKDDIEPRTTSRVNEVPKGSRYGPSVSPPHTGEEEGTMKFINMTQNSQANRQAHTLDVKNRPTSSVVPVVKYNNLPMSSVFSQSNASQGQAPRQANNTSNALVDPEIIGLGMPQQTPNVSQKLVYNDLVEKHNQQVEEYNKLVVLSNRNKPRYVQRKFLRKLNDGPGINNQLAEQCTNACQRSLMRFIRKNSHCFNSLSFLEDRSFMDLINTLRANPDDVIRQ